MKKFIALFLAVLTAAMMLVGCTQIGEDGHGAIIDVYMGTKTINLDPAIGYTDENSAKILSLIFQPLVSVDASGNVSKALAQKWEIGETRDGHKKMTIWLNTTYWSDGSQVQANDVVYAWKRILDPDFSSSAASMLYAIRGAYDAKHGTVGIDDIGLCSLGTTKLEVEFEDDADVDAFIVNMGSLALVPLRENKVKPYATTWSYSSRDLSTNGPFRLKKFTGVSSDGTVDTTSDIILERSSYYYLKQDVQTEAADKYVTPYRVVIHFSTPLDLKVVSSSSETDVITEFNNKELFYVSNLTKETATNFKSSQLKYTNLASTYSYLFNTSSKLLSNASVRYALSIAIDRTYAADLVGNKTTAATGLLPSMVFNTTKGTSFRKTGGAVLNATAQLEEAKQILADAGINPAAYDDIYVYYLTDSVNDSYASATLGFYSKEKAIATYVKSVWEELGFYVVLKGVNEKELEDIMKEGSYDVVGLDYQMISPYALYNLAAFSVDYSGSVDTSVVSEEGSYASAAGVSGYSSEAYNALIDSAFAETDAKKRASILHEAETMLLEDGAIMPVIFNTDCYVVSSELSGLTVNYWGAKIFTKASLKNYEQYLALPEKKENDLL